MSIGDRPLYASRARSPRVTAAYRVSICRDFHPLGEHRQHVLGRSTVVTAEVLGHGGEVDPVAASAGDFSGGPCFAVRIVESV